MTEISIDVLGTPAPKGSNRAMLRGGRAVFVPGGSKVNQQSLMTWDANVRHSASHALVGLNGPVFACVPLAVSIVFRMARPSGHWGKKGLKTGAPQCPSVKPDVDKLARSTLDALSGVVFDDDSRIVRLTVAKEYAKPGNEGASIRVWEFKQ